MPVILALDYGRRRLGLAVSDPDGRFVFPRETLVRRSEEEDLAALARACAEDGVARIVLGLPLNVDGTEGGMAREVRAFGERLGTRLGLPVEYFDERYTSLEADERLREQYRDPRKRRARVDQGAAALILRSYLDDRSGG